MHEYDIPNSYGLECRAQFYFDTTNPLEYVMQRLVILDEDSGQYEIFTPNHQPFVASNLADRRCVDAAFEDARARDIMDAAITNGISFLTSRVPEDFQTMYAQGVDPP
jgi:hypothetical protein